jgi:hypothetical protein
MNIACTGAIVNAAFYLVVFVVGMANRNDFAWAAAIAATGLTCLSYIATVRPHPKLLAVVAELAQHSRRRWRPRHAGRVQQDERPAQAAIAPGDIISECLGDIIGIRRQVRSRRCMRRPALAFAENREGIGEIVLGRGP